MKVSRMLVQLRLTTGMSPCTELRSDLRDDGAQCVLGARLVPGQEGSV